MIVRHLVGARLADESHRALDARETEDARRVTVGVEPGDVPMTPTVRHRPRLNVTHSALPPGRAVGEGDGAPRHHRVLDGVEGGFAGADTRFEADDRFDVGADVERLELAHRRRRRAGEAGLLPRTRGEAEDSEFVGVEVQVGQLVLTLVDAVADLVLEQDVDGFGAQRDAELTQLVLVPLEHPVEGFVVRCLGVRAHGLTDGVLRQRPARVEQRDDEVEQALGLRLRGGSCCHARSFVAVGSDAVVLLQSLPSHSHRCAIGGTRPRVMATGTQNGVSTDGTHPVLLLRPNPLAGRPEWRRRPQRRPKERPAPGLFVETRSTTKISVSFGPIEAPAPRSP